MTDGIDMFWSDDHIKTKKLCRTPFYRGTEIPKIYLPCYWTVDTWLL